jgi:acyl-CoA thioesterase-1
MRDEVMESREVEKRRHRQRYGRIRGLVNAALAALAVMSAAVSAAAAAETRLLVLGDSLTAGYGLPAEQAFPVRLEKALRERGLDVRVLNAGVSGDTTAGGLARLDWALGDHPQAAIVELGANDGLRAIDPAETRANLDAIVKRLKDKGVAVLVAGMLAPPNLGREFSRDFNAIFPEIAAKHGALLYPFFLDGAATNPQFNQGDGIHPNARGVDVIVAGILPSVIKLLEQARDGRS